MDEMEMVMLAHLKQLVERVGSHARISIIVVEDCIVRMQTNDDIPALIDDLSNIQRDDSRRSLDELDA